VRAAAHVDGRKLLYVVQSVLEGYHNAFGIPYPPHADLQEISASVIERRPHGDDEDEENDVDEHGNPIERDVVDALGHVVLRSSRPGTVKARILAASPGEMPTGMPHFGGRRISQGNAAHSGANEKGNLPLKRTAAVEVLRGAKLSLDRLREYLQSDPGYTKAMRRLTTSAHDQLGRHIHLDEVFMGGRLFQDEPAAPKQ